LTIPSITNAGKKIILKNSKIIFSLKGIHIPDSAKQIANPKPYHTPEINPHTPPTIAPTLLHFIISSKNFLFRGNFLVIINFSTSLKRNQKVK